MNPPADTDRGSATVETALLSLALLLLLGLVIVGGRIALASDAVAGVAGTAARDASLARTPAAAEHAARRSALAALTAQRLHCASATVTVDTAGFTAPPGTPASVAVDVTCTVTLAGIGVPGLPGTRTLHDHAVSPLDPLRGVALGFSNSEVRSAGNRSAGDAL